MPQERSTYSERLGALIATAARPELIRESIRISAFVGTLLNVINQFDALRGLAPLSYPHLVLNYVVPYCVATYGAARYALRMEMGKSK